MKRRLFGEIEVNGCHYFLIISSTAPSLALQFRPSRVLHKGKTSEPTKAPHPCYRMPHLCHLAPMPTCASPTIPPITTFHMSTSTHSTNQPAFPCLPFFFQLPNTLEKHTHSSQISQLKHFTMATTTSSFTPFFTHTQLLLSFLATLLLLSSPAPSCSFTLELKVSRISAAPAFLPVEPTVPSIPPTLAPDMMPLFPSPGGNAGAAPASTLPTIPSSPSPPNPDELQPNSAITPSGSAAASSAASSSSPGNLGGKSVALICGLVFMWWLELVDW